MRGLGYLLAVLSGIVLVGVWVYGVFFGGNLFLIVGATAVIGTFVYLRFFNREP